MLNVEGLLAFRHEGVLVVVPPPERQPRGDALPELKVTPVGVAASQQRLDLLIVFEVDPLRIVGRRDHRAPRGRDVEAGPEIVRAGVAAAQRDEPDIRERHVGRGRQRKGVEDERRHATAQAPLCLEPGPVIGRIERWVLPIELVGAEVLQHELPVTAAVVRSQAGADDEDLVLELALFVRGQSDVAVPERCHGGRGRDGPAGAHRLCHLRWRDELLCLGLAGVADEREQSQQRAARQGLAHGTTTVSPGLRYTATASGLMASL